METPKIKPSVLHLTEDELYALGDAVQQEKMRRVKMQDTMQIIQDRLHGYVKIGGYFRKVHASTTTKIQVDCDAGRWYFIDEVVIPSVEEVNEYITQHKFDDIIQCLEDALDEIPVDDKPTSFYTYRYRYVCPICEKSSYLKIAEFLRSIGPCHDCQNLIAEYLKIRQE